MLIDDGISDFVAGLRTGFDQFVILDFNNSTTATLTVNIEDDNVVEADGRVSVSLRPDISRPSRYTIAANNNEASVAITNDDTLANKPTIEIATEYSASGDRFARYFVTIDSPLDHALGVIVEYNYGRVDDNGDPIDLVLNQWMTRTVIINPYETYASFFVDTVAPSSRGATGSADPIGLMVRLYSQDHYTVGSQNLMQAPTVSIPNMPAISISRLSEVNILESAELKFEVSASPTPASPIDVTVHVSQTENFIASSETFNNNVIVKTVRLPATVRSRAEFSVALENDTEQETTSSGKITAVIQSGSGYQVGSVTNETFVNVHDDDNLPTLTITDSQTVSESAGNVDFIVTGDVGSSTNLTVRYKVSQQGPIDPQTNSPRSANFIDLPNLIATLTANLTFDAAPNNTATIGVPLDNDDIEEPDGTVSLTLQPDRFPFTYRLGSGIVGSAIVTDDDDGTTTPTQPSVAFTAASQTIVEGTGQSATTTNILVSLSAQPQSGQPVTVNYTVAGVTASIGDFALTGGGTSGTLTFNQGDSLSKAIPLTITADNNDELDETFRITLTNASNATLGSIKIHTVTIQDDDSPQLPVLSIADASGILAGTNAQFVITSENQFTGDLTIAYTPVKIGGNYLNETDNTDTTKPNTNSGLQRTEIIEFRENNGAYSATLSFATVDDSADADGSGSIMVTLNADPAVDDTYTVSQAQDAATATISVIRPGRLPTVSITGGDAVNEGQDAVFTVSTNELDNSRTQPLVVNLVASESGTNFISGRPAPTVSIPGGSTSALYNVSTLNDNVAGGNSGYITVTLGNSMEYILGDSNTTIASVGVRDNAGTRGPEAFILDPVATVEGSEMVFTVNLSRRPALNTNVYYAIHSSSTATVGADYTKPTLDYVTFRRPSRFPPPRGTPAEITKQIRIPLIHDNYDEVNETIVIELTSATNNYRIDTFGSRATGTITDHANDVVMVSVEDAAGLEGHSGNNDIPVTLSLNIPSTRDIAVNWATSVATGGSNDATADDFVVATSTTPAVISAGQLAGTFNVQSQGDTTANEGDETFTVTISNPTNEAQIADDTATVTIKSDEIPVLSIADGTAITEANPSDGVVNAVFTITSTQLPSTPNNALTVHYNQAGGSFLASSAPSPTSKSIEFTDSGGGVITGTLEIPIVNDTNPEANGAINVVLIEEQSGPGNTYSVDPASDTAKVDVRDDDAPKPVLSITGPTEAITEGVDENGNDKVAEFIVTAKDSSGTALNPLSPITILYNVADAPGDFLDASDEGDQSTATPVTFTSDGNGNYIYTISIPIGDDNVKQDDGDITVALRASLSIL